MNFTAQQCRSWKSKGGIGPRRPFMIAEPNVGMRIRTGRPIAAIG
jgi:hypothetical protein